jgi:hypothetical protein
LEVALRYDGAAHEDFAGGAGLDVLLLRK